MSTVTTDVSACVTTQVEQVETTEVPCDACGGTGHVRLSHVAALRRRLGLSQKELAARLGVGKRTVTAWEGGRHRPSRPTLALLERMIEEQEAQSHG